MNFCTKCGYELEAGVQFCTRCGAPVEGRAQPAGPQAPSETAAPASPQPAATTPWQNTPVVPPQQVAANAKSGCMPTVLVVLGVLALIAALGIGGLVYAGYKVKQKAAAFLHNTSPGSSKPGEQPDASPSENKPGSPAANPSGDAAGILDGLTKILGGDDDGDHVESINDTTPVEPCPDASLPSPGAARIPLQAGTVITTAWGMKNGDVESRNVVTTTTPTSFVEDKRTDAYQDDYGQQYPKSIFTDTVCNADLASANIYLAATTQHLPHLIHGVTRLRLSSQSFSEVKQNGKITLRYMDITSFGNDIKPNYEEGVLTRVEPDDIPYPMIVNDQRVTLPAIHLAGVMEPFGKYPGPKKDRPLHTAVDFYVIDDPLDPLVLLTKLKDPTLHEGKFRVEVVKIDFETPHPVNMVEKQLTEEKRAITYGIYFDFNKDTIKPESEPVLKQIVQAMTDHPDWKLTVNGHTDNIGGDAYNLDLSKRRAAAVKHALVTRYQIEPDRLSTNGYGASGPIDTNDTLEGRARNRRVELIRE
jgi:outer membrane protein OmpA-like peptidoglycan-associated protein